LDWTEILREVSWQVFLPEVKHRLYEFCYLLPFDLWTFYATTCFGNLLVLQGSWCGPAQKHQQGPITCSKWSNDSVQDKDIERGIECIGFEGFNQVRIEMSIGVSRGDPSTSYPCAKEVQDNLIWSMKWGHQRKQKNPITTWKQHGWLPFPFVSRIKGLHRML